MVSDHGIPVQMLPDSTVRLLEDVTFSVADMCGVVLTVDVPKGFVCDGASIPKVLWSIVGSPMDGGPLRAAITHDWLCCQARTKSERRFADCCFDWVMEQSGVPKWRRMAMYLAVRAYGAFVWKERK